MKRLLTCLSPFSLFILLAGVSPSLLAQPFGPGGDGFEANGSRLAIKLNRALAHAGADQLSEAQEELIADLVAEHRANRPTPDPKARNSGLRQAYAEAILSGDKNDEIPEIAKQMAEAMAERTANHLVAEANFQIALLNVLDQNQIQDLQDQFGEQGLLRLLSPRGGRGGKRGRGGPGGGPEGFSRERMRGASRGEGTGR